MRIAYSLQMAFSSLRANKLRSSLTMLGIVIGISAVILMVGILQGAASRITGEFNKLGSNALIITYNPDSEDKKASSRRIEGLTLDDLRAIQAHCDLMKSLSPELPISQIATAKYQGSEADITAFGVTMDYARLRNVQVERGRFISEADSDAWAKVCVVGSNVYKALSRGEDLLGQRIEIGGLSLTVVGVLAPKGRTFEGDADRYVFIPLSTVQKRLLGSDLIGTIYAEPKDASQMDAAKDQVWEFLMRRYNNLPGFKVDGFDSVINSIRQVTAILLIVLGSIAGLALLVSGIGIMNIMLVSVTERTREIGVRKAVGAKRRDILWQFLIEAATVSGLGGLIGIVLGTTAAYALGYLSTYIPALDDPDSGSKGFAIYVPPGFLVLSFCYAAIIGIFFGIYPAIRAARLDPIQALRHE